MIDRIAFAGISYYAILIVAAILLGMVICISRAREYGIAEETVIDFMLLAIPLGIIFARIYYVIFRFNMYSDDLGAIFNIREGGLAIYGGIFGGLLAAKITCSRKNVRFADLLDAIAPALILGQAIGRWGNYINMEAYGFRVENEALQFFPFAVEIPIGTYWYWQMATFFYEFCWDILVFLILWFFVQNNRKQKGDVFRWYILLYCAGRTVIEGLRDDSLTFISDFVRISQIFSGILAFAMVLVFFFRIRESFSIVFLLPVCSSICAIIEVALGEFERNAYGDLFIFSQIGLLVMAALSVATLILWMIDCRHFDVKCAIAIIPNLLFMLILFIAGLGRANEDNTYYVTLRQMAAMIQMILSGYLLCYRFYPGELHIIEKRTARRRVIHE